VSDQRSGQQRKAIEVYCNGMANRLDDAGFDKVAFYKLINKSGFKSKWTQGSFKDFFRDVMTSLYPELTSTAQLSTKQLQAVYEVVDRGVNEKTGVSMSFPSNEPPMLVEHEVAA